MNWFDKEVERLEEDLIDGNITQEEFQKEMRLLRSELRWQAEDGAQEAYNDVIGGW